MKKYTETEIHAILKENESGVPYRELCRRHGVAKDTITKWKQRYSGMAPSDMRRLKELEEEHNRLKRMYADMSMQYHALKDVLAKKYGSLLNGSR